jgi:hypothetical protein
LSLVEVYTHRRLTVPTDRIIAISGIAERYGRVLGDAYYAGMWRSSLSRALYWEVDRRGMQPRPLVWQGPSWSWTSINGPVKFPSLSEFDEEGAELPIVEVEIELANPANPYGPLLEGSGRLTLKTRTLLCMLTFVEDPYFGLEVTAKGIMFRHGITTFDVKVSYDALDATKDERDMNNVILIELSSICGERTWSCRGLVARGFTDDAFTRIGTFRFRTGRGDEENLADWHQRVFRDYSWFHGERIKIIDIV